MKKMMMVEGFATTITAVPQSAVASRYADCHLAILTFDQQIHVGH